MANNITSGMLGGAQQQWDVGLAHTPMASVVGNDLYILADKFIQHLMGGSPEREVKVEVENWSGGYSLVSVHILNTKTREITSIREPLNLFPSKTFLAKLELLK